MYFLHMFLLFNTINLFITLVTAKTDIKKRTFEIDYENDVFLKDGEPFRYISGSLHYYQVPRAYWRDRIRKYRAAGLNTISTYIEWKSHEPLKGKFEFSGETDIEHFLRLVQDEEVVVILRPGPYINSERDLGGLPPWLIHENPHMRLRTSDPSYIMHVNAWLTELFPRIQPLLYGNGGPIIMVQVENEYGHEAYNDTSYKLWLRDIFRQYVGNNAVLFTADSPNIECQRKGMIPGVLATVNHEPGYGNQLEVFLDLRSLQPHGPLVNSEFYTGWMLYWGSTSVEYDNTIDKILHTLHQYLASNVSFNLYMFHGGTNFGFTSGADRDDPPDPDVYYEAVETSYDFFGPISESGNLTEKYYAIKSKISEFVGTNNVTVNISLPARYGSVRLEPKVSLMDSDTGVNYGTFLEPKTFESLMLYSGFMLYETSLPPFTMRKGNIAKLPVLHDRTAVFIDKQFEEVLERTNKTSSLNLPDYGSRLSFLVETQGHIAFHVRSNDTKGLLGNVTLGDVCLGPWKHTGYPMTNVSSIPTLPTASDVKLPAFYSGTFQLPDPSKPPQDTFVDMTGWGKGVLYVNGHNLGRYWPSLGPQVTLYLPAPFLQQDNVFVMLELERENPNRTISLVDQPILDRFPPK